MSAPEELRELLEAYWQGTLDRAGAARLAEALRSGDGAAGLADEVEFASLLQRAQDQASGEELVRKFFAGMGIDEVLGAARPAAAGGARWRRLAWIAAAAAAVAAALVLAGLLLASRAKPAGRERPDVAVDPGNPQPRPQSIPNPAASPAGTVLAGAVEARRLGSKDFAPVPVGGSLSAGDAVRAGAAGPAEIAMGGGVRLLLDAGAEAVIAPDAALACAISLERGQVFADVAKGSPFSILTSEGSVKSLGTRFAVSFAGTATETVPGLVVSVEEGAVEVDSGGEVSRVASGCSLLAGRGCRARQESGECVRRRLGWVEQWRGACPGGPDGRGHGRGGGPHQGGRGRGAGGR